MVVVVDVDTMNILVVVAQKSAELCPWVQEEEEDNHARAHINPSTL